MSAESNAATESLEEWRRTGSLWQHAIGPVFTKVAGAHNVSAVLFIHGFPTASWDWAKVWAPLTAEFHCLALDMPGFGFSAKPRRFPYSIRAQADVLESFLAEQGVSEYAIVAHDYGDTVAQELMARHNEGTARQRLRKVALLNGGLFPETHQPVLLQKLLASPLGPLIARLTTYRKFSANMRRICALPLAEEELEGMWELMNLNGGMQVMPSLIGYMAERREHRERWVGALQKSTVPMMLANGLLDPISGAHMVARYRELIPSPSVVELEDAGHYPQVEAPARVTAALLQFLRT